MFTAMRMSRVKSDREPGWHRVKKIMGRVIHSMVSDARPLLSVRLML